MTSDPVAPNPLSIRTLLMATCAIAIGFSAATVGPIPLSLRLLGLAIGFYGLAVCIFGFSLSLRCPYREVVFLFGLPAYLCCVICASAGGFLLLVTMFRLEVS